MSDPVIHVILGYVADLHDPARVPIEIGDIEIGDIGIGATYRATTWTRDLDLLAEQEDAAGRLAGAEILRSIPATIRLLCTSGYTEFLALPVIPEPLRDRDTSLPGFLCHAMAGSTIRVLRVLPPEGGSPWIACPVCGIPAPRIVHSLVDGRPDQHECPRHGVFAPAAHNGKTGVSEIRARRRCTACGHLECPCCGDWCDVLIDDEHLPEDAENSLCCGGSCTYAI